MGSFKLKSEEARKYYTQVIEALVPSTVTIDLKQDKDGSFTAVLSGYGTAQEYMPSAVALKAAIRAKLEQDSPGALIFTKTFCTQLAPFADFKKSASTCGALAHGIARSLKTSKKGFGFEYADAKNGFVTVTMANVGFDWDRTMTCLREIEPVFCKRIPTSNDLSDADDDEEDEVDRALDDELFGEYEEEQPDSPEETCGEEEKKHSPEETRVDSGLPSPVDRDDTIIETTTTTAEPDETFTESTTLGEADPLDCFQFTDADAELWANENLVQSTANQFQWSGDPTPPSLDYSLEEADAALDAFVEAGLVRCSDLHGQPPDCEPPALGDGFDLYEYINAPLNDGADAMVDFGLVTFSLQEAAASSITTPAAGQKRKREALAQSYQDIDRAVKRPRQESQYISPYPPLTPAEQAKVYAAMGKAHSVFKSSTSSNPPKLALPTKIKSQVIDLTLDGTVAGNGIHHPVVSHDAKSSRGDQRAFKPPNANSLSNKLPNPNADSVAGLLNTLLYPMQAPHIHAQFAGIPADPYQPAAAFNPRAYPGYMPLNAVNSFQPQPYFESGQPGSVISNPLHQDYQAAPPPVWPYSYPPDSPVDRALKRKASHYDPRPYFKRRKSMLGQSVISVDSVIDLSDVDAEHVPHDEKAASNGQTAPNGGLYTDEEFGANLSAELDNPNFVKHTTYGQKKVPKLKDLTEEEKAAAVKAWIETYKQVRPAPKKSGPPEVLPPFSKVNVAFQHKHNMIVEQVQSSISEDKASLHLWRDGEQHPYLTIATASIKDVEFALNSTQLVLSREGEKNLILDFGDNQIDGSVPMHYLYHTHLSPLGNNGKGTDSAKKKAAVQATKKTMHSTDYSIADIRHFWATISRDHICTDKCESDWLSKKHYCMDWAAISKKDLKEWTRWVNEVYPSQPFHGMSNLSKRELQEVICKWIQSDESYAAPSTLSGARASLFSGTFGKEPFWAEEQEKLFSQYK